MEKSVRYIIIGFCVFLLSFFVPINPIGFLVLRYALSIIGGFIIGWNIVEFFKKKKDDPKD